VLIAGENLKSWVVAIEKTIRVEPRIAAADRATTIVDRAKGCDTFGSHKRPWTKVLSVQDLGCSNRSNILSKVV